jgi:preprotein translocase subunit SecD
VLEAEPFLDAPALASASARREPVQEQSQVAFELTSAASRAFEDATEASAGQSYAILLDGQVVSTPVVQGRLGNTGVIDLPTTPLEDARTLALVLGAGALPVPLAIVDDQAVGPAGGRASTGRVYRAVLLGVLLVAAVLVGYYRIAGVIALGALAVFAVLLLGGLATLDYTVTLAGLGGILLAAALTVDGCVLVFERIRDAQGPGRVGRAALDEGYTLARPSLLDSRAVALIVGLILYQVGSGAVRGFALALSVGVLTALLGAVFVTRTLFLMYLRRRRPSDPIPL